MKYIGNKYNITRTRDGSTPDYPMFVLGAKDPCAPDALEAYADACEMHGMDEGYVSEIRRMVKDWIRYQSLHGYGIPDTPIDSEEAR